MPIRALFGCFALLALMSACSTSDMVGRPGLNGIGDGGFDTNDGISTELGDGDGNNSHGEDGSGTDGQLGSDVEWDEDTSDHGGADSENSSENPTDYPTDIYPSPQFIQSLRFILAASAAQAGLPSANKPEPRVWDCLICEK